MKRALIFVASGLLRFARNDGERTAETLPRHCEALLRRGNPALHFRGSGRAFARPGGSPYLISTSPTWLVRLSAITGLPSGVTSMLRTMSPPPGMAQLWNFSDPGSNRTMVFGLAADSEYHSAPLV